MYGKKSCLFQVYEKSATEQSKGDTQLKYIILLIILVSVGTGTITNISAYESFTSNTLIDFSSRTIIDFSSKTTIGFSSNSSIDIMMIRSNLNQITVNEYNVDEVLEQIDPLVESVNESSINQSTCLPSWFSSILIWYDEGLISTTDIYNVIWWFGC